MTDRIRPSADWYRRKIQAIGNHDFFIGPKTDPQVHGEHNVPRALAFGTLVRLERRNSKLTIAELAKTLDIEEDELREIEHDPQYQARPRTIIEIARYFKLPPKTVMKLAGAAATNDERFTEKAMKFAAHSDDIGTLNEEEKKLLRSFVEFLRDS
ncbi:MAG TPA: helix-turn-helix transcriptional regulator [Parasulfuritortus sp.]